MSERYVDPNSGAAPQPGGFAAGPVAQPEQPKSQDDGETRNAVFDHEVETQAAPGGEQPANPEGTNAGEDGTTEEEQGGGALGDSQAGASGETEGGQSQGGDPTQETQEQKDYSQFLEETNSDKVQDYMDEHPEEAEAIKAAEAQREKPRKGVLEH